MSAIEMVELAGVQALQVMDPASLINLVTGDLRAPTSQLHVWAIGDRPRAWSVMTLRQ